MASFTSIVRLSRRGRIFCRYYPSLTAVTMLLASSPILAAGLDWNVLHQELDATASDAIATVCYICTNLGDREIIFEGIRTSCGCTTTTSEPAVLFPGQSGSVTARVDLGKQAGARQIEVSVRTDEPQVYRLTAQISVPPIGYFAPPSLHWETGEARSTKKVFFRPAGKHEIHFDHIDFDGDKLAAKVLDGNPQEGYSIEVHPLSTEQPTIGRLFVFASMDNQGPPKLHLTKAIVEPAGSSSMSESVNEPFNQPASGTRCLALEAQVISPASATEITNSSLLLAAILLTFVSFTAFLFRRRLYSVLRRSLHLNRYLPLGMLALFGVLIVWLYKSQAILLPPSSTQVEKCDDTSKVRNADMKARRAINGGVDTEQDPVVSSTNNSVGPKLMMSEREHCFHSVDGKNGVRHCFHFRNEGDADLTIKMSAASSGQLSAIVSGSHFSPKEEGAVCVNLTFTGQSGPQNHSVLLETNDPAFATIALHLHGTVEQNGKR